MLASTARARWCSSTWRAWNARGSRALQPCVSLAATMCIPGCNHVYPRLQPCVSQESSKKSYSVEGESAKAARREEARHINVSLFALGSVVAQLSSTGAAGHVPYRNSKLTRLLQPSLGGNCAAAFVVTLRAESQNVDECISTLRFAQRAKVAPPVTSSGGCSPM